MLRLNRLVGGSRRWIKARTDVDEFGRLKNPHVKREHDHYDVLQVARYSTDDEIKRAHKNLVKVFHPDAPGGGDEALFRQIQDAFETLSDKERRTAYDRQQREKEAKILPTIAHQSRAKSDAKSARESVHFSLSREFPKLSPKSTLVIGMAAPRFRPTIYPKVALGNLIGGAVAYHGIVNLGWLASSIGYWSHAVTHLNDSTLYGLFNTPLVPTVLAAWLVTWVNCSLTIGFICHLCNPSLVAYSIVYDEGADTLVLHLADAALIRPKSLFLKIEHASQRQLNLAEDCQHQGLFAHTKSFSFDAPVEHGLNSSRLIALRKPRGGAQVPEKAVLDAHLTVHIPHYLEMRDAQCRHVPLVKFIRDRRRYRSESTYEKVFGSPLRELN